MAKSSDNNTIWVSVGLTKNIGNYESLRLDAGASKIIEAGDDRLAVYKEIWQEVQDQIEGQLKEAEEVLGG